jgi:hypothetical protein
MTGIISMKAHVMHEDTYVSVAVSNISERDVYSNGFPEVAQGPPKGDEHPAHFLEHVDLD